MTTNVNAQDLRRILFLDIETVSSSPTYEELDERGQALWQKKSARLGTRQEDESDESYYARLYSERAAIFAEFGQIVCISVGFLVQLDKDSWQIKVKSFASELEIEVLDGFAELLNKHYADPGRFILCGHNIREFDIPYLCRRMLVHGLPLPAIIDIGGRKPWEVKHLHDTLEMWKFGDIKNYTSLDTLSWIFGIESPKGDLDGSMVGFTFWEENDLYRIAHYCNQDVVASARVYLRMKNIDPEIITDVNFV